MPFMVAGDVVDMVSMVVVNLMEYSDESNSFLDALYKSVGASTAEQKYNTLILRLGYENQFIGFSQTPSWEQKQRMMEYELLGRQGLIKLTDV